jgi:hypothetical protein
MVAGACDKSCRPGCRVRHPFKPRPPGECGACGGQLEPYFVSDLGRSVKSYGHTPRQCVMFLRKRLERALDRESRILELLEHAVGGVDGGPIAVTIAGLREDLKQERKA